MVAFTQVKCMPLPAQGLEKHDSVSFTREWLLTSRKMGVGWAALITVELMKRKVRSTEKEKQLLNQR